MGEDHEVSNGHSNGQEKKSLNGHGPVEAKSTEEEAFKDEKPDTKIIRQVGPPHQYNLVWKRIIFMAFTHIGGTLGLLYYFTSMDWRTLVFCHVYGQLSVIGITAGAHRLWAHKAYKAKLPFRIFLMLLSTASFQGHLMRWCRDHRQHHKFSDTDADPSNSSRGFFFSHFGWLLVKKHPDAYRQKKQMDVTDLKKDPVVMFQYKNYLYLVILMWGIVPTVIPVYFWQESIPIAFVICCMWRYTFTLQGTCMVNSAAHLWGHRPFNRKLAATESHVTLASLLGLGEGWHNFHHAFPQDYRVSEMGWKMNMGSFLIDCAAAVGQAYDLKFLTDEQLLRTKLKYGDGTRMEGHNHHHH